MILLLSLYHRCVPTAATAAAYDGAYMLKLNACMSTTAAPSCCALATITIATIINAAAAAAAFQCY
eukprot:4987-Heterococcus_DN1.PRE.2